MHRCILFVDEHHHLLASINDEISGAISQACSEIIDGKLIRKTKTVSSEP
nr:hypothetical protein [uncultured Prevotella sp.]